MLDSSTLKKTNKKFDLIFLDGDHSYEGCKRDIEKWWPRVKNKTGILAGHDFDI